MFGTSINIITKEVKQIPLTEKEVSDAQERTAIENAKQAEINAVKTAEKALQAEKEKAFIDSLPSWIAVSTAVDNIANFADTKAFIKKLARVVYWLAKNSES